MAADRSDPRLADGGTSTGACSTARPLFSANWSAAGFPVPPGFVVTAATLDDPGLDDHAGRQEAAAVGVSSSRCAPRCGRGPAGRLVRRPETYLNVPRARPGAAVRRASPPPIRAVRPTTSTDGGVAAMAVLVQVMVDPVAAGVAFTAHPVTGDRDRPWSPRCPGWVIRWYPVRRSARSGRITAATPR